MRFSQRSIPESLMKKIAVHEFIQRLLKPFPFYTI